MEDLASKSLVKLETLLFELRSDYDRLVEFHRSSQTNPDDAFREKIAKLVEGINAVDAEIHRRKAHEKIVLQKTISLLETYQALLDELDARGKYQYKNEHPADILATRDELVKMRGD